MDGNVYNYGFEAILSQKKILSEWLFEIEEGHREKKIFTRDTQKGTFQFNNIINSNTKLKMKLEVYAGDIANDENALFLSVMNNKKERLYKDYNDIIALNNVYSWFKDKLDISENRRSVMSDYSYLMNEKNFQTTCKLIEAFKTGIEKFKIENISEEEFVKHVPKEVIEDIIDKIESNKIKTNNKKEIGIAMRGPNAFFILEPDNKGIIKCKTLKFKHSSNDFLFNLDEESDGTIRILDLLEVFMAKEGKTFIIDELDRCLHPSLTYKFISLFFELAKIKKVQLIVTTHESRLLDFQLLRREEIWFVDKRKSGASDIYSLSEFNDKFDSIIDKAYFEGRYGGVPIFNSIFPIEKV